MFAVHDALGLTIWFRYYILSVIAFFALLMGVGLCLVLSL